MDIEYNDNGLQNVRLKNGFRIRETEYGRSVSYEDLDGLLRSLASALVRKPGRLTSGEFRWLRKYIELSQEMLADAIGRDAQTVSLIERGRAPDALFDSQLRRIALEKINLRGSAITVMELTAKTRDIVDANYYGTYGEGWSFSVIVSTPHTAYVSAASEQWVTLPAEAATQLGSKISMVQLRWKPHLTHAMNLSDLAFGFSDDFAQRTVLPPPYFGPTNMVYRGSHAH